MRFNEIASVVPKSKTLADIGCDQGYISLYLLKDKRVEKLYACDISEKCLNKAKITLKNYLESGVAEARVCDGLDNLPEVETVLIAGMGGEEIIKILEKSQFLPDNLVLQPMKNVDKVRKTIVDMGYKILKDYVFYDKKFYDLIVAKKGKDKLTEREIVFGRTNVNEKGEAFLARIKKRLEQKKQYLKKAKLTNTKTDLEREIELLESILK